MACNWNQNDIVWYANWNSGKHSTIPADSIPDPLLPGGPLVSIFPTPDTGQLRGTGAKEGKSLRTTSPGLDIDFKWNDLYQFETSPPLNTGTITFWCRFDDLGYLRLELYGQGLTASRKIRLTLFRKPDGMVSIYIFMHPYFTGPDPGSVVAMSRSSSDYTPGDWIWVGLDWVWNEPGGQTNLYWKLSDSTDIVWAKGPEYNDNDDRDNGAEPDEFTIYSSDSSIQVGVVNNDHVYIDELTMYIPSQQIVLPCEPVIPSYSPVRMNTLNGMLTNMGVPFHV